MATICERLNKAMAIRQIRQVDLVEKTGITKGAISSYVKGNFEPKAGNLYLIAKALNVDEAWLMGYDVPMEKTKTVQQPPLVHESVTPYYLDNEASVIAQEMHDRPELRVLFDASRKVSAKDLQFVIDMLDRFKSEEE